jgi:hypothetical protein
LLPNRNKATFCEKLSTLLKETLKTYDYVWRYDRFFVILPSKLKDKYEKNDDGGPRGADGMHDGRGKKESEVGRTVA